MLTVVLTGDVGAGKSTVARVWREMGAVVVDSDAIAKEQWDRPEIRDAAIARWGSGVYGDDGRPIYAAIARAAFAADDEYQFMKDLVLPSARAEIASRMRSSGPWVAAEIPLLFESDWRSLADVVVYAAAPLELRAERNAGRGLDEAEILRREAKLLPREDKIRMSDVVIVNDGTVEQWEARARELGERFARGSRDIGRGTH